MPNSAGASIVSPNGATGQQARRARPCGWPRSALPKSCRRRVFALPARANLQRCSTWRDRRAKCRGWRTSALWTSLRLAGTGLERLRVADLLGLERLGLLDLSDNRLAAWPTDALTALPALLSLNLDGNRIGSLPETLGAHEQLRELRLSRNGLAALQAGAWRGFGALERLHLSDNELPALPSGRLRRPGFATRAAAGRQRPAGPPARPVPGLGRAGRIAAAGQSPCPVHPRGGTRPHRRRAVGTGPRVRRHAAGHRRTLHPASRPIRPGSRVCPAAQSSKYPRAKPSANPRLWRRPTPRPWWSNWPPPIPTRECEHGYTRHRPCFQGIATAAGEPLVLFKRPPVVAAPVSEQPCTPTTPCAWTWRPSSAPRPPGPSRAFGREVQRRG